MAITPATEAAAAHRTYHHGNLAQALAEAGLELARTGGPDAVVLREAARRVGVSATAAYRHFDGQSALMEAVKQRALLELADALSAAYATIPGTGDPRGDASRRLEALGRAYVRFALQESGLFRTFCVGAPDTAQPEVSEEAAFGVLAALLEDLLGDVDEQERFALAIAAWSAVHGLAVLTLDGPLALLDESEQERLFEATFRMVRDGLLAGR